MAFDSIMSAAGQSFDFSPGLSAADFPITHWKLFTEGRSFSDPATRCEKDVVEGSPYEALCGALDSDANHSCTFQSFPTETHCGKYSKEMLSLCFPWFRGL